MPEHTNELFTLGMTAAPLRLILELVVALTLCLQSSATAHPHVPKSRLGVLKNAGSNQMDVVATKTGTVFVAQSPEQFTHDLDGNVTSDGRWQYTWDAENRLIAVESLTNAPSASRRKIEWTHDAQGRRIRQNIDVWDLQSSVFSLQSSVLFAYDGWQCLAEFDALTQAPSLTLQRTYVWGLDLSGTEQGAGGVGGSVESGAGQADVTFRGARVGGAHALAAITA